MITTDFHVAVPTAFTADEELDIEKTIHHIRFLQNQGVQSVLVCGSTGEQHSLLLAEKLQILHALEQSGLLAEMEVIFGVASIRQKEAVLLAEAVAATKVSGILLGFPPYILPSQRQAKDYADAIISVCPLPVILYNNPKRTGFHLESTTLLDMVQRHTTIIGLKEAGDKNRVTEIRSQLPPDAFAFYAGGEADLAGKIAAGFDRLSSINANILPQEVFSWFTALLQHKEYQNKELFTVVDTILKAESPLPKLKQLLKENGSDVGNCRSPLK